MGDIIRSRTGRFPQGWTEVTSVGDSEGDTGICFSILRLAVGDRESLPIDMELALLHLDGRLRVAVDGVNHESCRTSVFDESPFSVHVAAGTAVIVEALSDVELAVFQTPNSKDFPARVYSTEATENEHRGKGLVDDASLRFVRTIFDGSTSHPNTQLVLGEVVNFPGRWSSYPPHHHPQPEIYHYRFTRPEGYGHAELGEEVYKVRSGDTVKILDGVDHAQCSAPGYGMYYIWAIRHLERCRYTVPEFTEDHRWTMDPSETVWSPKEEALV